MNQDEYCYPFSIQFRTAFGSFSALTDPALLAQLKIVEPRYSIVAHFGNAVSCATIDAFYATFSFCQSTFR